MERERTIVSALILLQLVLWLGFAVHRSPRFPGSLSGGVLAVAGALLMVVVPVAYSAVKRIPRLKKSVTARVSMRTLLTWHVYTGVLGSILALLHTAHRFESNLGIALTAMMLITVFSGYLGRHLLAQVSLELHEKQELLSTLQTEYNRVALQLSRTPDSAVLSVASHGIGSWMLRSVFLPRTAVSGRTESSLGCRAVHLAESIADLEYAIKTHQLLKKRSARWLTIHIVTSLAFYALLTAHIWASVYFGLRWLS
jgi:hypothetical protein